MQEILIGFAFVMALPLLADKTSQRKAADCRVQLRITETPSLEKVFPVKERKNVAAFFKSTTPYQLPRRLRKELERILWDEDFLVAESEAPEFQKLVDDFMSRGGRISLNMDYFRSDLVTVIFTRLADGAETIQIPAYKLIRAAAGNPDVKLSLLSDIAHELQHSLSNRTKKQQIEEELGKALEGSIFTYLRGLSDEDYVEYIFRSELEALAAERKFVPNASNSLLPIRYYPALQALQSLLTLLNKKKEIKNFNEHLRHHSLYQELLNKYVDCYLIDMRSYLSGRRPDKNLVKSWMGLANETNFDEAVLKLAIKDLDVNLDDISGRLVPELHTQLYTSLRDLLVIELPRLREVYRSLLNTQVN